MRWIACALAAFPLALCWPAVATAEREPTVLVEVAAVVGDAVIFDSDVRYRLRGSRQKPTAASWRKAVDELITEQLLVNEFRRRGMRIADAEIDQAMDSIRKQNGLTALQLQQELNAVGYTMASYRRDLAHQLRVHKMGAALGGDQARATFLERARKRAHIEIREGTP